LGYGLLGTLQLPYFAENKATNEQCAFLNFMESLWTDIPQLGCWHPHKSRENQDGLAFSSFIPNALYQPGIATHAALWMLQRVDWVHGLMWPDLEDQPIEQISGVAYHQIPKEHSAVHDIEMHEVTGEFARCWDAAGNPIQSRSLRSWLKAKRGMIQIKGCRSIVTKNGAWHHFLPSKWPQSRLAFSAWLYSPSSCLPFGQNHEGRGAPKASATPPRARAAPPLFVVVE
jgi:hypothetical protein